MTITKDGDVIIHKKTWEMMQKNADYQSLLEDIDDIEMHIDSMNDDGGISLDQYLKKRNIHV